MVAIGVRRCEKNSGDVGEEPAMSDEQGFLEQLRAEPGDEVTRLVYADWLQERGDVRGEYLRLEQELGTLQENDPRHSATEVRLLEMMQELPADWLAVAGRRFDVWL